MRDRIVVPLVVGGFTATRATPDRAWRANGWNRRPAFS